MIPLLMKLLVNLIKSRNQAVFIAKEPIDCKPAIILHTMFAEKNEEL
jgi:hypothetical protein